MAHEYRNRAEAAACALLTAGSAVLAVWLCARMYRLLPLYTSSAARNDFNSVMVAYVRDYGWGLSNHAIKAFRCTDEECAAELEFRYLTTKPSLARDVRLSWKRGYPEAYAME